MRRIGALNNIHTMMVSISDNFTMGIENAAMARAFVKSVRPVPMHYNTFEVTQADPQGFFVPKAVQAGLNVKL